MTCSIHFYKQLENFHILESNDKKPFDKIITVNQLQYKIYNKITVFNIQQMENLIGVSVIPTCSKRGIQLPHFVVMHNTCENHSALCPFSNSNITYNFAKFFWF